MKRVRRLPLPRRAASYLERQQALTEADNVERRWKFARQTHTMRSVVRTLQTMMGPRERCMYCMDSHGSDIEHFRPKSAYPDCAFDWNNLLLCCAECGRFKGARFPLADGQPLLVNPVDEDPWQFLDFDPDTGNITARYDLQSAKFSPKGLATVELLQLDRREALAEGGKKTFRRLVQTLEDLLAQPVPDTEQAARTLLECDDHGLLGWCLQGEGAKMPPFCRLPVEAPQLMDTCLAAIDAAG